MELYDYNLEGLKAIWSSKEQRQHAQLVIMTAIGKSSEVTIAQAHAIMAELDDILIDKEEETSKRGDRAI